MADTHDPSDSEVDDVPDKETQSDLGKHGRPANGGDQAGPSSDQAGKPLSPQTGDPNAPDRSPN